MAATRVQGLQDSTVESRRLPGHQDIQTFRAFGLPGGFSLRLPGHPHFQDLQASRAYGLPELQTHKKGRRIRSGMSFSVLCSAEV